MGEAKNSSEVQKKMNELLEVIKEIHKKYPSLRLGQMIGTCYVTGRNIYYGTDEELAEKLKEIYLDVL